MARRPAVSTSKTSTNDFLASEIAARTMSSGFCPASEGKNSTSTCCASVFSCSIAAGR